MSQNGLIEALNPVDLLVHGDNVDLNGEGVTDYEARIYSKNIGKIRGATDLPIDFSVKSQRLIANIAVFYAEDLREVLETLKLKDVVTVREVADE